MDSDPLISLSIVANGDGVYAYVGIPIVEPDEAVVIGDNLSAYAALDSETLMKFIGALFVLHTFMEGLEDMDDTERAAAIEHFQITDAARYN
jgi:hypothetical protein